MWIWLGTCDTGSHSSDGQSCCLKVQPELIWVLE